MRKIKTKRLVRKIHRIFVQIMNWIFGAAFMLSLCMVEAYSWIPFAVMAVSGLWLLGYAWANGMLSDPEKAGENGE